MDGRRPDAVKATGLLFLLKDKKKRVYPKIALYYIIFKFCIYWIILIFRSLRVGRLKHSLTGSSELATICVGMSLPTCVVRQGLRAV